MTVNPMFQRPSVRLGADVFCLFVLKICYVILKGCELCDIGHQPRGAANPGAPPDANRTIVRPSPVSF